jgi:hypothetical protein
MSYCFLPKGLNVKIHKTILLTVVLYGCEAWSHTLREEYKEQDAEENIWTLGRGSNRRLEKNA